jgi:hypothetical protein
MKKVTFVLPLLFFFLAFVAVAFKPAPPEHKVVWTQVVRLEPTAAASGEETMGLAIFRLTSDRTLTYKLIVQRQDEDDPLTAAHFHYASTGRVAIGLVEGIANLGHFTTKTLTQAEYDLLVSGAVELYVNVHSMQYPGGIISGDVQ